MKNSSKLLAGTVAKDFYIQFADRCDSRRAVAQTIHRLVLLMVPLCIVALLVFPDVCRAISSSANPDERGTVGGRVAGPDRVGLQGARVEVQPLGLMAVTDEQGQ